MIWFITFLILAWGLSYYRVSVIIACLGFISFAGAFTLVNGFILCSQLIWVSVLVYGLLFLPTPIRRLLLARPAYLIMKKALPPMSQTEREALEAGNTWWDAELFSGRPKWQVLEDLPPAKLSDEERAFLQGPVETLCAMLDDWDITHKRRDLPPEVWDFIKHNKFCGIIIPKQYGGLEFSEYAHSQIVMKISSRCSTAAVTVMVPNSLGPAKLLLAYGTEPQKDHYLPKLATGEEMPCFALTGPNAGSDAGAMPDNGVICHDSFQGKKNVLGIRLNWEKRYITLGPVATVIGLAFKLYDPDHLLGASEDIGITVALIPADTPGISIGKRHFPLDSAFQNGPNWGEDVFIPMDWVIGGADQVGNGWKMLMQCLATGRSISLPALSVGASKFTCRNTGAYARIRKQFNIAIGEFEGIEEVLARMAGETYILDAARTVTAAALDNGEKPSVISAIIKYELTERMRRVVNDGMDIQGGSGICLGPRNYLGRVYQAIPVSITVEGANILTRTMMIFGQGAVRCHPFVQQEMQVLQSDSPDALKQFDRLLFGHFGHILGNASASFWLGLTGARWQNAPGNTNTRRYYQQINRFSAGFALLADYGLLSLGGALKRKERISGLYADALSNLYLCSAVLKHYQDQDCPEQDLASIALGVSAESLPLPASVVGIIDQSCRFDLLFGLLSLIVFPTGRTCSPPDDKLIHQLAQILLKHSDCRDRLTDGIYINNLDKDPTGRIEQAFDKVLLAAPVEQKLRLAQKQKLLAKGNPADCLDVAIEQGIITNEEAELMGQAELARTEAISVDYFDVEELIG